MSTNQVADPTSDQQLFSMTVTFALPGAAVPVQQVEVTPAEVDATAITVADVLYANRDQLDGKVDFDADGVPTLCQGVSVSVGGRVADLSSEVVAGDANTFPLVVVAPEVANG